MSVIDHFPVFGDDAIVPLPDSRHVIAESSFSAVSTRVTLPYPVNQRSTRPGSRTIGSAYMRLMRVPKPRAEAIRVGLLDYLDMQFQRSALLT